MGKGVKGYNSKDPVILKSNALIEAEYSMTLAQSRLLYCLFAKIQPKTKIDDEDEYTISAIEFGETFGLNSSTSYEQLKQGADDMFEAEIVLREEGVKKKTRLRWAQKCTYLEGEGLVSVVFSSDIKTYISELDRDYVMIRLYMAKHFKKTSSFRLYEIACRYDFRGDKYYSVDEFREIMQLADKYENWSDIERYVLKPGCEEVSKFTDREISYEVKKLGRKTVGLTIFVTKKSEGIINAVVKELAAPVVKMDYESLGYRQAIEYEQAMAAAKEHNVTFANAAEYYLFIGNLRRAKTKTGDLFG